MRRLLRVALVATLFLGTPAAHAQPLGVDKQECLFNSMNKKVDWTQQEELRTAWCVVERWSVPGGHTKFNQVASCESHWYRFAYNSAGPYVGIFQHLKSAWPERVQAREPAGWDLNLGWANPRSQIVVTARTVHSNGSWAGWGCA